MPSKSALKGAFLLVKLDRSDYFSTSLRLPETQPPGIGFHKFWSWRKTGAMKNLAYFAISAALVALLASIYAPPNVRLHVEFQTTTPQR